MVKIPEDEMAEVRPRLCRSQVEGGDDEEAVKQVVIAGEFPLGIVKVSEQRVSLIVSFF